MKVHWTETAQEHLRAIHDYIALDSVKYAKRTVDRIVGQIAEERLIGTGACANELFRPLGEQLGRMSFDGVRLAIVHHP